MHVTLIELELQGLHLNNTTLWLMWGWRNHIVGLSILSKSVGIQFPQTKKKKTSVSLKPSIGC